MSIGRGIDLDGLDKNIAFLFPKELRDATLLGYPKEWPYQILRPGAKQGHTR